MQLAVLLYLQIASGVEPLAQLAGYIAAIVHDLDHQVGFHFVKRETLSPMFSPGPIP